MVAGSVVRLAEKSTADTVFFRMVPATELKIAVIGLVRQGAPFSWFFNKSSWDFSFTEI
jgi:hypothetical protein